LIARPKIPRQKWGVTMKRVVLATVILFAATGAAAAPPAGDAAAETASASPSAETGVAPPAEERKICRTEKATGSLTRRNRICLTAAQWREVHDRTRRGVGEMQGSASGGNQCIIDQRGACQGPQTPGASFGL
jgi:hypothetical protein